MLKKLYQFIFHLSTLRIAIAIGVASTTLIFFSNVRSDLFRETPIGRLEQKILDFKFIHRGRLNINTNVVIGAGDDKTIERFGRWPWDRSIWPSIIKNLVTAGADVIAFDMVFSDETLTPLHGAKNFVAQTNPQAVLEAFKETGVQTGKKMLPVANQVAFSEAMEQLGRLAQKGEEIEKEATPDEQLAAVFEEYSNRVVQGYIARHVGGGELDIEAKNEEAYAKLSDFGGVIEGYATGILSEEMVVDGKKQINYRAKPAKGGKAEDLHFVREVEGYLTLPRDEFLEAAEYVGFFSVVPDSDGVARRVPLVFRYGEGFLGSLSLNAVQLYFGAEPALVQHQVEQRGLSNVFLFPEGQQVQLPVSLDGSLQVNYYGPSAANVDESDEEGGIFDHVSLADIHDNKFDPALVKGKVILIAVTALGTFDQRVTPFSSMVPGVEVHAAAIQNMIDGSPLRRDSVMVLYEMALSLLLALFLGLFLPRLSIEKRALLVASMMVGWYLLDQYLFFRNNMWFHQIPLQSQIFFTWAWATVWGYLVENKDKRMLTSMFKNYISPELIDQMVNSKQMPQLGGNESNLTAYFTDIASFSTFSEKIGSPTKLVELLNEYLTAMTDILLSYTGTLDKYEGDAIIAFYGAPMKLDNHALSACKTALAMQDRLGDLRKKWHDEGDKWPEIVQNMRMRIGLNSGQIVTGNMGSNMRMNYTMMGDAVNTAARLESGAKQYGVFTMCSEQTLLQAGNKEFASRLIDKVKVMGKTEPVITHELLSTTRKATDEIKLLVEKFNEARELFVAMNWDEAEAKYRECLELEPFHPDREKGCKTTPSHIFIERCQMYRENPPVEEGETWDGVFTATAK